MAGRKPAAIDTDRERGLARSGDHFDPSEFANAAELVVFAIRRAAWDFTEHSGEPKDQADIRQAFWSDALEHLAGQLDEARKALPHDDQGGLVMLEVP